MPPPPPLPSLRRVGSRSGGGGGGSDSEGNLPFRGAASFGSPASGFNERVHWSDAGQLEEELRLIPTSGLRLGLGLPPDCEVPFWCLTGCSGFRSVAGDTRRGARPLSHPGVDRSLGGGSRSTTRSCCRSQRRGIQDSCPGSRWKEWVEPWIYLGSPRTGKSEPIALWAPAPIGLPRWGLSGYLSHEVCSLVLPPPVKPIFQPAGQILKAEYLPFTIWVIKLACCCTSFNNFFLGLRAHPAEL